VQNVTGGSIVRSPRTHIYLGVEDAKQSALFYEALLGGPPTRQKNGIAVFEFEVPPLVLTIETRLRPKVPARARYALDLPEPQHLGIAAVALRRAGARLLLHDAGIEVSDPDGNTWMVRFTPLTKSRSVGG
jgi:catechol-2,3-dioxygenase